MFYWFNLIYVDLFTSLNVVDMNSLTVGNIFGMLKVETDIVDR